MDGGKDEETTMAAINQGFDTATRPDDTARQADATGMLLWSAAALMELLVLVGGLMWIMSGPGAIGMAGRVTLVALGAVLGGGAFACLASRRQT